MSSVVQFTVCSGVHCAVLYDACSIVHCFSRELLLCELMQEEAAGYRKAIKKKIVFCEER